MENLSLILEGGGMRGVYTGGALDFFIENNIEVDYLIGVSAGACKGASFISKQIGRNYRIDINYINDKRYLSFGNLIKTGSMFGMDMLFNIIPNELEPFDHKEFLKYKGKYVVVATNCETGEAEYLEVKDFNRDMDVLKASISLPLIAPIVNHKGKELLDGGISDPIPIDRAIKESKGKYIVVLTQSKGYVKEENKSLFLIKRKYKKYPKLIEAMKNRHIIYNETVKRLEEMESLGECFILRPSVPLGIGRLEKDKEKLIRGYKIGYEDAKREYKRLMEYLNK